MTAPRHRRRQRGIALLLVLWAFMILGVLAFDFGRTMREDAMAAINFADETQGYYVAVAAINTALLDEIRTASGGGAAEAAAHDEEDAEDGEQGLFPADGEWHAGTFHGATYEVRKTDECGRIGINGLVTRAIGGEADDRERLRRIVTNLLHGPNRAQGKSQREAQDVDAIVQAIIDWVDPDNETTNGAEREWYRANRGYEAKNWIFDSLQELLLVRGVTADLFYGIDGRPGLRDVVSVYCGDDDTLNARTVTAAVLEVVFELEPEEALELVEQRKGADSATFLPLLQGRIGSVDPALADHLEWTASRLVMVEARADTSRDRNRSTVAAVVDLSDEFTDGPNPIRWFDRAPWTGSLPTGEGPGQTEPTS